MTILGFTFAFLLALAGSMFGLIGTQGMHGNEPFLPTLGMITLILVLVNGVAAAVGLTPLLWSRGTGDWLAAVLGFAAGAVVTGLLTTISLLENSAALYAWPVLLPPVAGWFAMTRRRRHP